MKKAEIMNKVSRCCNKAVFELKKHSPEILVVAGVAGTVVSAVMACKATMRINEVLEEPKKTIEKIHETRKLAEADDSIEYPVELSRKHLTVTYAQAGLGLAKLYAPAIILGGLSITSILASNNILRKRNVALAAAYATIDKGFKEYRARVVDRFGEQVDYELLNNVQTKEIEEKIVDEKGKEKIVKKTIEVADPDALCPYAKYFTQSNPYWDNVEEYRDMFLRSQENYANDLLIAKGFLTLNEVYQSLGMEETKAGMVVGWKYDPENPVGDNYVDFGIRKVHLPSANGEEYEEAYLLNFNVDGNIYNTI